MLQRCEMRDARSLSNNIRSFSRSAPSRVLGISMTAQYVTIWSLGLGDPPDPLDPARHGLVPPTVGIIHC
jgi:hypothetical protein